MYLVDKLVCGMISSIDVCRKQLEHIQRVYAKISKAQTKLLARIRKLLARIRSILICTAVLRLLIFKQTYHLVFHGLVTE